MLKNVARYGDVIISLGFKELGIVPEKSLNALPDINACEILTSYNDLHIYKQNIVYAFYLDVDVSIKRDQWAAKNIAICDELVRNSLQEVCKILSQKTLSYPIDPKHIYVAEASGDDETKPGFFSVCLLKSVVHSGSR